MNYRPYYSDYPVDPVPHFCEPDLPRLRRIRARIEARQDAAPDEDEEDVESRAAMIEADLAELQDLQDAAKQFAMWLRRNGAEQMEMSEDDTGGKVAALSNAFNKAARAVRQIVVLKHEVAGLRATPHARAPANGNTASGGGRAPRGGQGAGGHDDRTRSDIDDYNEYIADEGMRAEDRFRAWWDYVLPAIQADLIAAGLEVDVNNSPKVILGKRLPTIPHPNLDQAILEIEHHRIAYLFGPDETPVWRGRANPDHPKDGEDYGYDGYAPPPE
jgi:hypothetical protein